MGEVQPRLAKLFKLPGLPPSINSIYNVMFSLKRIELKPEVRAYKSKMKMYVPMVEIKENDRLTLSFDMYGDWYYKNGKLKKVDVQNMAKCVIDLVCEKLGVDDSMVWDFTARKLQSENESVTVALIANSVGTCGSFASEQKQKPNNPLDARNESVKIVTVADGNADATKQSERRTE